MLRQSLGINYANILDELALSNKLRFYCCSLQARMQTNISHVALLAHNQVYKMKHQEKQAPERIICFATRPSPIAIVH